MHCRFAVFVRGLVLIVALSAITAPGSAADLVLHGAGWSITIEPGTLQVTAMPAGSAPLVISTGAQRASAVTDLKQAGQEASWALPSAKLRVEIRLDDDVLVVRFEAAEAASFTWPVLPGASAPRAYILPMFEGLYIPADDKPWAEFLVNQGAFTTTAGLSMPFWGLDCGRHSLTYILDNPFNNELEFTTDAAGLGLKLTHTFTRNQKVKQLGFRIHLGDASPVTPARLYRKHLIDSSQFVSLKQKLAQTPDVAKLPGAPHIYLWGDGFSTELLQLMSDSGIDRAWLGSADWDKLGTHPDAVEKAIALGYLVGPYDSFHSIHSPDEPDTWETAQFDRALYETGGVVKADGSKRKGFKQKGFVLSPRAARPFVEKRVSKLMNQFRCNSWFIDCDAFGDVFDDYSDGHAATQEDDARERLSRMAWIRDKYSAVIGSEGGSAYAAPVIHFAHGMTTPVIGWGDAEMSDRSSKYFVGAWYPSERPATFFKTVPMKEVYRRAYADPLFRLPLYEMVFHDSVVATHQWLSASLKFEDADHARELLELLYNVPPLYHLDLKEWRARKDRIARHFQLFSPLHRESALLPMTNFEWLSADRLVQQTKFGDRLELVANFSEQPFPFGEIQIPGRSFLARWTSTGKTLVYTPED